MGPERPTTALVVAGGRSTRFSGGEKALARFRGTPLIRRVADALATRVDGLVVNCRADQVAGFERALAGHDPTFAVDEKPDTGPLAGLRRGLDDTAGRVAVAACDMPTLPAGLFDRLLESDADAAVPVRDGRPQPLCAVYRAEPTRRAASEALAAGERSLRALLARLDAERVPADDFPGAFRNVNTRAELAAAEREAGSPESDETFGDGDDGKPYFRRA